MALRGENVGTAYIRILADGSGLDRSIRDEFTKAEPSMEQSGERHSEKYWEGFNKNTIKQNKENRKNLLDSLAVGRGAMDARAETIAGNFAKELRNNLRKALKGTGQGGKGDTTLADTIWNNLMGDFRRSGNMAIFSDALENLPVLVERATRQVQAAEQEAARERQHNIDVMLKAGDDAFAKSIEDQETDYRLHIAALKRADEDRLEALNIMLRDAYREDRDFNLRRRHDLQALQNDMALLARESAQLFKGDPGAQSKSDLTKLSERIHESIKKLHIDNSLWNETLRDTDRRLRRVHPTLDRFIFQADKASDAVGKAFGKGSRNNFLNFTGSLAGGLTNLTSTIFPRAIRGVLDYRTRLHEAFDAGGTRKLLTTLFTDAGKLGGALAGGLAGLFGVVGPLISLLSLLAGTVVALSASILGGAVGALGALAGAFVPVAAGIGVMVAAFQNAPASATRALNEITGAFAGLGGQAAAGVFGNITEQAQRLRGVLGDMGPTVRAIGDALSRVADHWLDMMEGPGFASFRSAFEDFLPSAVERLGNSLGNTFAGIGGVLRGLIPITQQFLGWLEQITGNFAYWANGIEGQEKIANFFEVAGRSAAVLGDFLASITSLLGTIILQASAGGDTIFGSMTNAVDHLNDRLRANPQILTNWINDAVRFSQTLGNVFVGIVHLFDTLDTEFSRAAITFVFQSIATTLEATSRILGPIARLFSRASDGVQHFAVAIGAAVLILPRLAGAVSKAQGNLGTLGASLKTAEGRTKALSTAMRGAAGVAGLTLLTTAAGSTNKAVSVLGQTAGGAALGFSVGGPWGAAIGGAAGLLTGLLSPGAQNAADDVDALTATLDKQTGALTALSREWVVKALQDDGAFEAARTLGLGLDTVTDAALGNADALATVNAVIANSQRVYGTHIGALAEDGEAGEKLNDILNDTSDTLEAGKQKALDHAEAIGAVGFVASDTWPRLNKFGHYVTTTGNAADGTTTAVTRLTGAIKTLSGFLDKRAGFRAYQQSLDDFRKSLRENGNALNRQTGNFNRNTQAGRDNEERLDAIVSSTIALTDKMNDTNKMKFMSRAAVDIRKIAKDMGLPKSAIDEVIARLQNLDKQNPRPHTQIIDGVTKPVTGMHRDLENLGRFKVSPKAVVDTGNSNATIASLRAELATLHDHTVHVTTVYSHMGRPGTGEPMASGGIVNWAQKRLIGEAGPEAVVPLDRPLNMVDPAVRWLSAIAQGLEVPRMASGGVVGNTGRTVNVGGITVVSPQADAAAVATETVNRLVAVGY